jgi:hypothetical protein
MWPTEQLKRYRMKIPPSPILSGLPDLKADAIARIQDAYRRAVGLLLEGTEAGWRKFIELEDRTRIGTANDLERIETLESAHEIELSAQIDAYLHLFDAIAAEYSGIDIDRNVRIDWLHKVVLRAVRTTLPSRNTDEIIFGILLARLAYSERRIWPEIAEAPERRRRRGRPTKFPDELKERALEIRRAGGTNSECARVLYGTKRPTEQQVKNVPKILNYYQERRSPPNS